jgi:uncharacterized protein involved in exopolysaccharide biosynthesis
VKASEAVSVREEGELDLSTLWQVLYDYRRFIAIVTVLFAMTAAILSLVATPIFRAQVVVTEAHDNDMGGLAALANQFGGLASLAGVNLGNTGGAGPQARGVLESRWLVEEFIKRNNLVRVILSKPGAKASVWSAAEKFRNSMLTMHEDKLKSLTTVAVNWTDPAVAAEWANGLVALANELLRERAMSDSSSDIAYLNEQLAKTNEIELRRVIYSLIEQETKTLMLAKARKEYAFAVVDPAVPPELRYSPKRTLMTLLGFAFGLIAGTAMAFMHRNFKRPVQQRRLAPSPQLDVPG